VNAAAHTGRRAGLDKRPQEVAAMFDAVAERYDRTNAVLSLGLDRGWRRAVGQALELGPGLRVLDLAAGTATSTLALAGTGCWTVGVDFSLGMLRVARSRPERRDLPLVAGDGLALPFADASFDRVTVSFGLRNVADPAGCLAELARVTRPGGRLVICEFSHPVWAPWRRVYLGYLMAGLPVLARAVSSDPQAYVYLAESIRAWPDQAGLARLVSTTGWSSVAWRDLAGGVVALHRALRAPSPNAASPNPAPSSHTPVQPAAE
jgi:demethylmenaquinone methyltransferase/2-methoxy-6-polyprenyl-1,4-benzoquinol methylase